MRWLSRPLAIAIHQEAIARFGGSEGLRDEALLESALARPQQIHAHEKDAVLSRLAAAYCAGIVRNHPFVDGNKRLGFLLADTFLRLNGRRIQADPAEIVLTIEALAAGRLEEAALVEWIERAIVSA